MSNRIIRLVGLIVALFIVFGIPFTSSTAILKLLMELAVFTVLIASSNILTGVAGQVSVGQGAFFGVGAYGVAVLTTTFGWSAEAALPVSIVLGIAIGLLAGLPALRISGMYLALTTLALALVFPTVIVKFSPITGGADGIRVAGLSAPSWFWSTDSVWTYTIFAILAILILLGMRNLIKSSAGRALVATRDNPLMATAVGVDVRVSKLSAFGISGAIAGLAGWMFAVNGQFIGTADFGVLLSINVLAAMYLGGSGSVVGPIVGAVFIRFVPDAAYGVGVNPILVPVITGVLLIVILRFLPEGIASVPSVLLRWLRLRGGSDALSGQDPTSRSRVQPEPKPLADTR